MNSNTQAIPIDLIEMFHREVLAAPPHIFTAEKVRAWRAVVESDGLGMALRLVYAEGYKAGRDEAQTEEW